MRRIETEAGILVGKAERVSRTVAWHLECPDCETLILLDGDMMRGRKPTRCPGCGWKTQPVGTLGQSGPHGVYVYYDFIEGAFDEPILHVEPGSLPRDTGLRRDMRL